MRSPIRRLSFSVRELAQAGCAALVAGSCAPHRPTIAVAARPGSQAALCQLVPPPQRMADSLWIVATDRVTPMYAPTAHTLAERVVFPLLYSIPIAPHCDSIVARPVVAAAFPDRAELVNRDTMSSQPFVADSFHVGGTWSPRTGPYEIAAASDTALDLLPRRASTGPNVHFSAIDDRQGRDAIDAGADIVFTSDARTIAYAAAQSDLTSIPLMWDRVYVLIEPTPRNHGDRDSVLAVQRDLATNTLKVEARPATDSVWGESCCPAQ